MKMWSFLYQSHYNYSPRNNIIVIIIIFIILGDKEFFKI